MTEPLFHTFLEDEAVYDQAAAYWQELLAELLTESDLDYTSYLNTTAADGTPLRDGNPILNAWFPALNKALRIIQEEPDEEEPELGVWQDTACPGDEPTECPELVISLVLAETTAEPARQLIRWWVVEDLNFEEILEKMEDWWGAE